MTDKNKTAIITGAGSGLGQATAVRMAEDGINIVVVDVNEKGGNETVEMVKKLGADSIFIKTDVSKAEEVKNYVDKTVEKFGKIDYFFNNAGISGSGAYFLDTTIEEIEKILKNAEVVVEDEVDLDKISVGCKVRVHDFEFDEDIELKLVGSTEANSLEGKISNESPVGKALMGAHTGDIVEVELPSGIMKYKVLEIQRNI